MQSSVLDAIQWMQKSWQEVKESIIHKCYKNFDFSVGGPTDHDEEETEAPEEANNNDPTTSRVLNGVYIKEFVSFDDNTSTTLTLDDYWEEEIFREARGDTQEDVAASDSESDLEEIESQTPVT